MLQGTIPMLPEAYLTQRLAPHQLTLLQLAMANRMPADDPALLADLETALDALELTWVWGRTEQGYAKVRAFLIDEERLFSHVVTYALGDPSVPQEVRARKFTWIKHVDELFVEVMAQCQAVREIDGAEPEVLTEDHPEMDAIGFRVVNTNEVWLIARPLALDCIQNQLSIHPEALALMNTTDRRRVLARALGKGVLTNIQTLDLTMAGKGWAVTKAQRRASETLKVDRASRTIADAFMAKAGRKP